MKFTVIGLVVLLALTTTSSTEAISQWGPMVMMWLLTAIGTWWVLAGEANTLSSSATDRKAA